MIFDLKFKLDLYKLSLKCGHNYKEILCCKNRIINYANDIFDHFYEIRMII